MVIHESEEKDWNSDDMGARSVLMTVPSREARNTPVCESQYWSCLRARGCIPRLIARRRLVAGAVALGRWARRPRPARRVQEAGTLRRRKNRLAGLSYCEKTLLGSEMFMMAVQGGFKEMRALGSPASRNRSLLGTIASGGGCLLSPNYKPQIANHTIDRLKYSQRHRNSLY